MKFHNIRLFLLRNKNNILTFITTTIVLCTFIVVVTALQIILMQSQRNESILRSIACILLINPDQRNKENVQMCVDNNGYIDTEQKGFIFKSLEDIDSSYSSVTAKEQSTIIIKDGKKGEKGDRGVKGLNGTDSISTVRQEPVNGKDGDSAYKLWLYQGNTGTVEDFLESLKAPTPRGIEINCINDFLVKRYDGDISWVKIGKCTSL